MRRHLATCSMYVAPMQNATDYTHRLQVGKCSSRLFLGQTGNYAILPMLMVFPSLCFMLQRSYTTSINTAPDVPTVVRRSFLWGKAKRSDTLLATTERA